jgi:transcriptional antiterminator RfaH
MAFWTVVRTHPNSEKIAAENLKRQEFVYYQPLLQERKVVRGRVQQVSVPLFPNYIFVNVIDRWRSLNSTHGVASLITSGSMPAIVQDHVIADLRKREVNGFIQLPKAAAFKAGDKVLIKSGLFASQTALVQRMPVKERQKILLALLSNKISILVDESDIAKVT